MGLFSSKYETYVATVAQRAIKDELLPNSVKTGVFKAILNGTEMVDEMMEGLVHGMGQRVEQMYTYGAEHYVHGLPSGQFTMASAGLEEYTSILSEQEGAPVSINYFRYGHANLMHLGWMQLILHTGYSATTNEIPNLSNEKGWPVYLQDMVVVVPSLDAYDPASLELWGRAARAGYTPAHPFADVTADLTTPSPIEVDPAATAPYVRVTYNWQPIVPGSGSDAPTQPILVESFPIALENLFEPEVDYFHAKYSVGGVVKFSIYKSGAGIYPVLDTLHIPEAPTTGGTFFPFVYFRYNKTSELADKTTDSYLTGKKLVKYLGMNFDQVADAIDQNPSIADVEQAMLTMSVPAETEDPLEQRYLFQFFHEMWLADPNQLNAMNVASWISFFAGLQQVSEPVKGGLLIQDKRFKMALTHSGITRQRVAGTIGDVGTYASGTTSAPVIYTYYDPITDTTQETVESTKQHFYRKQVATGLYDEIIVSNLKMRYDVFGNYTVVASEGQDILLIPLDHSLTHEYSITEREMLYARSLHYVFNSKIDVEIKWYAQDWFQAFILVVSVFFTAGALSAAAAAVAAAVEAGTIAALNELLIALLTKLLEGMAVSALLKMFVHAIGGEAAMIIAAVATVIALYTGYQAGSLKGAPWAEDLLKLSAGLSKAITADLKDKFNALSQEYAALQEEEKAASEDLAGAQKLLEQNRWLSPFTIFGESPDEFYNRTIHSGNIGITAIGAISEFVDNALRLPELEDTLGARNAN